MSDSELKIEFQQISEELQKFDEYGKQLQIQIENLQNYLIDLARTKATLLGLQEEQNVEETLVQLGSGIMIRAKPLEPNTILTNIGAGVIISKPLSAALEDLDNRIDEAEKERIGLAEQLNLVINQINLLERKAQTIYQQIQGPSKAQYDPTLVS